MLCSETIVQKFPLSQVNLAAQYQLLRRGSTAPLRVQINGKFNGFPKFPITQSYIKIEHKKIWIHLPMWNDITL